MQTEEAAVKAPNRTRRNAYYSMVERVIKRKAAIVIALVDPKVKLTALQQLGPSDWELAETVVKVLKPSLVASK